jgi:hypothetical protein
LYHETFVEDRSRTKRNASPIATSDQHQRVRQMVDRLESSTTSSPTIKSTKKFSTKKSFHDDHSDGSITISSSPPFKRIPRRENQEKNLIDETFNYRHKSPHDEVFFQDKKSNVTRFSLNRDEIINGERRTTSGATVSCFM